MEVNKELVKTAFIKDVSFIKQGILQKFKTHLAFKKLFKGGAVFSFEMPLMEVDEKGMDSESVKSLYNYYYNYPRDKFSKKGGKGFYSPLIKKAFVGGLGAEVLFSKCDIDREAKKAYFEVDFEKKITIKSCEKELRDFINALDEALKETVTFELIAKEINALYDVVKYAENIEVLSTTFILLPVMTADLSEILKDKTREILKRTGMEGALNIRNYMELSSHLKKIEKNFKKAGYQIYFNTVDDKNLQARLSISRSSVMEKTCTYKDLAGSREFLNLINKREEEFGKVIDRHIDTQHKIVANYISNGGLDNSITAAVKRFIDSEEQSSLKFEVKVPFSRKIEGYKIIDKSKYKSYRMAERYLSRPKNSIGCCLRERYPFLEGATIINSAFRDGMEDKNGISDENQLCFTISLKYPSVGTIRAMKYLLYFGYDDYQKASSTSREKV